MGKSGSHNAESEAKGLHEVKRACVELKTTISGRETTNRLAEGTSR